MLPILASRRYQIPHCPVRPLGSYNIHSYLGLGIASRHAPKGPDWYIQFSHMPVISGRLSRFVYPLGIPNIWMESAQKNKGLALTERWFFLDFYHRIRYLGAELRLTPTWLTVYIEHYIYSYTIERFFCINVQKVWSRFLIRRIWIVFAHPTLNDELQYNLPKGPCLIDTCKGLPEESHHLIYALTIC